MILECFFLTDLCSICVTRIQTNLLMVPKHPYQCLMVQVHGSLQLIVFAEKNIVPKFRLILDVRYFYFLQILVHYLIFLLFPQLISLNISWGMAEHMTTVLKTAQELCQHTLACTSNFVFMNSTWPHSLSQILISFLLCNCTSYPYLIVGQMLGSSSQDSLFPI